MRLNLEASYKVVFGFLVVALLCGVLITMFVLAINMPGCNPSGRNSNSSVFESEAARGDREREEQFVEFKLSIEKGKPQKVAVSEYSIRCGRLFEREKALLTSMGYSVAQVHEVDGYQVLVYQKDAHDR